MKLSECHEYTTGYIILNLPVTTGLPKTISIMGNELLLKNEFHISLIKVSSIAKFIDENNSEKIESEIVNEFKDFLKDHSLEDYTILNTFRFVQRDIRKTVIALAEVPYLSDFFDGLRQKYEIDIPTQPTHVTMYTLQPEKGIGLLSEEELQKDSQPVRIHELRNIQFV